MSKKKTKKKKKGNRLSRLEVLDLNMNNLHEKLKDELLELEKYAKKKKKKINKKAKKKAKNGLLGNFSPSYEMQKVDYKIAKTFKEKNILSAIEKVFMHIKPIVITISRLVAYLINLIMDLPNEWKIKIPFKWWARMEKVYWTAMAIR